MPGCDTPPAWRALVLAEARLERQELERPGWALEQARAHLAEVEDPVAQSKARASLGATGRSGRGAAAGLRC